MEHLGLVAVKIKELGISEFFEKKIPKLSQHNVTVGQVVAAMILVGLGYVHRALHITPEFLKGWDLEKLIGPGVQAEHFNDDVIGRALDAIYAAGSTELFLELLISILPVVSLGEDMRFHVDTTSVSVYGQYAFEGKEEEEKFQPIRITHGHSKDNHPELKQFLLGLVSNQNGIPCYFSYLNGNRSDNDSLSELIQHTVKHIQSNLADGQKALYIADSALYTQANVQAMGKETLFISRAPATIRWVQELEKADLDFTPSLLEGYAMYRSHTDYGDVPQTLVVVESQAMKKDQLRREAMCRCTYEELWDRSIDFKSDTCQRPKKSLKPIRSTLIDTRGALPQTREDT